MILDDLMTIIEKRIKLLPSGSYVASVYKEGEDKILQKIGEEAIEVILSAKKRSKKRLIEEIADLFFMIMILMSMKGISYKEIFCELEKRQK